MQIVDIHRPEVKIIKDLDQHAIERESTKLCMDGWCKVGQPTKHRNDWTQILVREQPESVEAKKPGRPKTSGDKALKKIVEE